MQILSVNQKNRKKKKKKDWRYWSLSLPRIFAAVTENVEQKRKSMWIVNFGGKFHRITTMTVQNKIAIRKLVCFYLRIKKKKMKKIFFVDPSRQKKRGAEWTGVTPYTYIVNTNFTLSISPQNWQNLEKYSLHFFFSFSILSFSSPLSNSNVKPPTRSREEHLKIEEECWDVLF